MIDTASRAVIATIAAPSFPSGLAVTPDGQKLYVSNGGVSVINTATNTKTTTILINRQTAYGVTMNPLGTKVYVPTSGGLAVIDTATDALIATFTITPGFVSTATAFTPDGARLFLTNRFQGTISVLDTVSNTILETAPAGKDPATLTIPRPASGLSSLSVSF